MFVKENPEKKKKKKKRAEQFLKVRSDSLKIVFLNMFLKLNSLSGPLSMLHHL